MKITIIRELGLINFSSKLEVPAIINAGDLSSLGFTSQILK